MDRRSFLETSVLGSIGVAGAATAGCSARAAPALPPAAAVDMDAFFAQLDGSMAAISRENPFARLPRGVEIAADPATQWERELLQRSLRTLLLVGSFQDLPEEARTHPEMQARMWRSLGEMDAATRGMTDAFEALTATERADIGRALRADPGLGMRLLEAVDEDAARHGVSMKRRTHMRALGAHICTRLRQSTPLLVDEYVGKVRKIEARHGARAELERMVAAALAGEALAAPHEAAPRAVGRVADASGTVPPPTFPSDPAVVQEPEPSKPGSVAIPAGLVLLGLSTVTAASGGIVIGVSKGDAAIGGFVLFTVAGILLLAGLITLIVGLVLRYG